MQALSGHSWFAAYLHKYGKLPSPKCWYCGKYDNAEHTIFQWTQWQVERSEMVTKIGLMVKPENIIEIMINNKIK